METTRKADDLIITSCPNHGVKVTSDSDSHYAYVEAALEDDHGWMWDNETQTVSRLPHARTHDAVNGSDPWRCCWHMVIDPDGIWDY